MDYIRGFRLGFLKSRGELSRRPCETRIRLQAFQSNLAYLAEGLQSSDRAHATCMLIKSNTCLLLRHPKLAALSKGLI